ncbi:GNAT family N-acetyltransferase [Mesorhizobium australafricanum]|uniref:GNAT family N-acetyltransferase n=1 Tax=Mesorhizobium australafricanum TaxID=3072311 RepID=A0ABU4X427_9HYPH|nr:GNAT family N-acetyltransferase [Mesorhizobium sp. VK3E]MDX8443053.1 GNAT family N-acetyltransferase [Mesorhizobium sp. VK3E]
MRLATERLILRPWEDKDRDPMARIYGDAHVRRFSPKVLTVAEAHLRIDLAVERARTNGFHYQAAELKGSGELIGLIGLGVLSEVHAAICSHPRVEIGWMLAKEHWGKGLATEGARAWLDYAWSIGLLEVSACTARENAPSQRVMQKIGMIYDPTSDYENPTFGEGHWLRPGVVYRKRNPTLHELHPID